MNAKKKNKHRTQKPQTAIPSPNAEVEVKKCDQIETDCPISGENVESVIEKEEIVKETLTETSEPRSENVFEEPKKPKRNKGKKKKTDQNFEETSSDKKAEISAPANQQFTPEILCKETNVDKEIKIVQDVVITPVARKKKGKNKIEENLNILHTEKDMITHVIKADEGKNLNQTIEDNKNDNILQSSVKTAKKKKKNKKARSDSERSDKGEEITCTSAFQKILQVKQDGESLENRETRVSQEDVSKSVSVEAKDLEKNIVASTDPKENVEQILTKKKGKKDKKNLREETTKECEDVTDINKISGDVDTNPKVTDQELIKETGKDLSDNILLKKEDGKNIVGKLEVKEEKIALETEELNENIDINKVTSDQEDDHNRPKEDQTSRNKKKNKKCKDKSSKEDLLMSEEMRDSLKIVTLVEISDANKIIDQPVMEVAIPDKNTTEEENIDLKPKAKIAKPVNKKTKGKSLKNEPDIVSDNREDLVMTSKPEVIDKTIEQEATCFKIAHFKIDDIHESRPENIDISEAEVSQTSEALKECEDLVKKQCVLTQTSEAVKIQDPVVTVTLATDTIITDSGAAIIEPTTSKSIVDDVNFSENLHDKKVKKSKSNKKSNKSPLRALKSDSDILYETGDINEKNESESKFVTDFKPIISEITPDVIEHPRSTSADIIDGNNNMMIQEINTPDITTNTSYLLHNPLIQGSGETPVICPDSIVLTSQDAEPKEKTDLKSKVMEVNKDMEDLRRSIERSLAELTALDKEDQIFESQVEKASEMLNIMDSMQTDTKEKYTSDEKDVSKADKTENQREIKGMHISEQNVDNEGITKTQKDRVSSECEPSKSNFAILDNTQILKIQSSPIESVPVCPARKENKGKNKSKKKIQVDVSSQLPSSTTCSTLTSTDNSSKATEENKKQDCTEQQQKTDEKSKTDESTQEKAGKQQSDVITDKNKTGTGPVDDDNIGQENLAPTSEFNPVEKFEEVLMSSDEDVNKSFEILAADVFNDDTETKENLETNETDTTDTKKQKENPIVSQSKNLLGHPPIPARSNKIDYKKEKNKTPNNKMAKVKIKDSSEIEKSKQSKQCQTENKPKLAKPKSINESVTCITSENDEYIYKYSFRQVHLTSNCHVCKKELKNTRVYCNYCHLLFYCNPKHKDEDWPQHQGFCFAVSTVCHLKGLKHIYADSKGITGHNYRLLRMQMIIACEKVLKRKLQAFEQEALLYPRICADPNCREWKQSSLKDCIGCGQISYCADKPEHCPKNHARWCKSYELYQKLVVYQLTNGRLEPKLPTRILNNDKLYDNVNRLLADMYDEKIDMNELQYAALTQLATAPLTAAFSYQLFRETMNIIQTNGVHKNNAFTIHVVGAELQFEADSLHKWETFFLHLRPDVVELKVVFVGPDLNPSNLPLDLLSKIKLCPTCRLDKRRLSLSFHDKQLYHEYCASDDFVKPDIVCAFNSSISRMSTYSIDTWKPTLDSVFKLKTPFLITAYTMNELQRDLNFINICTKDEFKTVSEAKFNPFSSVRPDRNFITDDEMPLLFKNYCFAVLVGTF